MKVALAISVLAAAAATSSGEATISVPMRDTVLPTFDAVSGGASTVTMSVVLDYMASIEDADLATYADAMPTKKNKKTAESRITNYYDAAEKCAKKKKKKLTKPMTQAQFTKTMKKVKRCLNKKNMPVFEMVVSANSADPVPVGVDTSVLEDNAAAVDDDDDDDDEDEDEETTTTTSTDTMATTNSDTTYTTDTSYATTSDETGTGTSYGTTTDTTGTTTTDYTTSGETGTSTTDYTTSGETGTSTTDYTTSGETGTTTTDYTTSGETGTTTTDYTTSGETGTTTTDYTTSGETGTSTSDVVSTDDYDYDDMMVGLPNPYTDDAVDDDDATGGDDDDMVVGMPNPYADDVDDVSNPNLRGSDEEPIADQPISGQTDATADDSALSSIEEQYEAPPEVDIGGFGGITEADVVATDVEIPLSDMPAADDTPTSVDDIPTGLQTPSEVQELGAADIEIPEQEQTAMMIAEAELVQPMIVGGDESSLPPPDWVLYGPESMEDAVATAAVRGAYPFSPASPVVPPFWAVDFDDSNFVTPHEWGNYVGTLKELALLEAAKTRDGWALGLLTNIINYHYANLGDCIGEHFSEVDADDMDNVSFEPFASWVQGHCYVKFRYSLFAGPPPFEWVARNEPAISAGQIKMWVDDKLEIAKNDLAANRVYGLTAEDVVVHEALAKCAYAFLDEDSSAMINRDSFYQALTDIVACASDAA